MSDVVKFDDLEEGAKVLEMIEKMEKYCKRAKKKIEELTDNKYSIQVTLGFLEQDKKEILNG